MTHEAQVFRPTKKNRTVTYLINFTALLLFGGALWYLSSRLTSMCLGMFILAYILITLALLGEWLQLIRKRVQIDETTISAHAGRETFKLNWDELISINLVTTDERSKKQELIIFTQNDKAQFDLTGFDKTAVWQAIETYAPPEILEPEAYKKLEQYQQLEQEVNEKLDSMPLPVSVTVSFGWKIFFIVGCLFLSFCAYGSFTSNTVPVVTYFFLFMALICLYGFISTSGTFAADTQKLTVKKLWGVYQINWSEIKYIEISSQTGWIVFHGDHKRLCFAAPGLWGGKQKNEFDLFTGKQAGERQLETKTSWKAAYRFNKNVRVS